MNMHYFSRQGKKDPEGDLESIRAATWASTGQMPPAQSLGGRAAQSLAGMTSVPHRAAGVGPLPQWVWRAGTQAKDDS